MWFIPQEESQEEAQGGALPDDSRSVTASMPPTPRTLDVGVDAGEPTEPLSPRYTLSEEVDRFTYQHSDRDWRRLPDARRRRFAAAAAACARHWLQCTRVARARQHPALSHNIPPAASAAAAAVVVHPRVPLPMDAAAAAAAADAVFKLGVVEVERRIVRTSSSQPASYHSSRIGPRGDSVDGGEALRLCHQPVRLAEVAALGPALAAHPHVRTLTVSHACLDDAAVHALVPLLQVRVEYSTRGVTIFCPGREIIARKVCDARGGLNRERTRG
jgi:hypothetical protein